MLNIKDKKFDVVVVGAGIAGAVLAERYSNLGKKVLVIEKRDHIGGRAHDYRNENGTIVSDYPSQLFHTNDDTLWNYVNLFAGWRPWTYKVAAFDKYQYMPTEGFTAMLKNMLIHPNIEVMLSTNFFDVQDDIRGYEKLFYTGPMERFYTFRQKEEKEHEYPNLNFVSESINGTFVGGLAHDENYPIAQSFKNALNIYFKLEEDRQPEKVTAAGLRIAS